jgi:hypothetical protein
MEPTLDELVAAVAVCRAAADQARIRTAAAQEEEAACNQALAAASDTLYAAINAKVEAANS